MSRDHLNQQTALSFLLADLSLPAARRFGEHLISGCTECTVALSSVTPSEILASADAASTHALDERRGSWFCAEEQFGSAGLSYGQMYGQVKQGIQAVEQASPKSRPESALEAGAHQRVSELAEMPFQRQQMVVFNSAAYHDRGVVEALLAKSWSLRFDDMERAEHFARLALAAAERCAPLLEQDFELRDLQARCAALVANALRSNSKISEAWAMLERAGQMVVEGSCAPSEVAHFLEIKGTLLGERERVDEAVQAFRLASILYRAIGEGHLLGRSLINLGFLLANQGEHEMEIKLIQEGLSFVDPGRDSRLVLAGWHNLICSLHDGGRSREAFELLAQARPLYLHSGDRTSLVRFQWVEGMIARSLERPEQAEGCFQEARKRFIEQGIPIDAALVSLDLAGLLLQQGRQAEVLRLATEMLAVFKAHQVEKEALAAYLLLHRAVEQQEVTVAVLREVERRLDLVKQTS